MKRLMTGLAALTLIATQVALAQPHRGGPAIEHLAQELHLTPAQESQVREIFAKERGKRDALRAQLRSETPEQRHATMQTVRDELMRKLSAVLTPEQMQKFRALQQERMQHMQGGPH